MSGSDRGNRLAFIGSAFCILAVLGAVIVLYAIGALQGRQAERAEYAPYAYRETAKAQAERVCVTGTPAEVIECSYDQIEASHQTAHDHQDLFAQELAAWSALTAAGVGVATLIVSGFGLWFIRDTLVETRRAVNETVAANDISRDTAKRQLRAYVVVTLGGITIDPPVASIIVTNRGETPARDLEIRWNVQVTERSIPPPHVEGILASINDETYRSVSIVGPQEERTLRRAFAPPHSNGSIIISQHPPEDRNGLCHVVFGQITYRDAFNESQSVTFMHRYSGPDLTAEGGRYFRYGNTMT